MGFWIDNPVPAVDLVCAWASHRWPQLLGVVDLASPLSKAMNRWQKLNLLAIGFFGGWGVRGLYESPDWWRHWRVFEFLALLLVVALILYVLSRMLRHDGT